MSDAVLVSLAQLGDTSQFVKKEGVPVFRPHKRVLINSEGKNVEIVVTAEDLPEIADHMKSLAGEGRAFRVTNGHIKVDGPEKDQPELLAFQLNPRVGTFGPEQIPCVLVDEYAKKDKLEILKERPYRSAEYYRDKKLITGCAALVSDPFLNLGVVLYNRAPVYGKNGRVHYKASEPWMYAEAVPPADKEKKDINEPQTPEPDGDEQPKMPDDAKDNFSPEEVAHYERCFKYMKSKGYIKYDAAPAAGPGMPGAGNVAPPNLDGLKKKEPEMNQEQESPVVYALRQEIEAEKRARQDQAKHIERIDLERKKERAERFLDQLEHVDYREFDRAETFTELMASAEDKWSKTADRIKKYHPKKPNSDSIQLYSGHVEGGRKPAAQATTPEQVRAAISLASSKGIEFDDALKQVKSA